MTSLLRPAMVWLLVLGGALVTLGSTCQLTFEITPPVVYGPSKEVGAYAILEVPGDGFLVGTQRNPGGRPGLVRLDGVGQARWFRILDEARARPWLARIDDAAVAVLTSGTSGSCLAGVRSSDGVELWRRCFPQGGEHLASDDTGLFWLSNTDGSAPGRRTITVYRADLSGNTLWTWSRELVGEWYQVGLEVTPTGDGGVYVATSELLASAFEVTRLTPVGTVLWQHAYPSPIAGRMTGGIARTPDGGVLLVISVSSETSHAASIDGDGTLRWTRELPFWNGIRRPVAIRGEHRALVAGGFLAAPDRQDGLVVELALADGSVLSRSTFPFPADLAGSPEPSSIIATTDGGFAFADTWVVKWPHPVPPAIDLKPYAHIVKADAFGRTGPRDEVIWPDALGPASGPSVLGLPERSGP